jgi:hypothetical protein
LTALGQHFDCIRLVSVDGEETHGRPGDSFVDDTTTGVMNDDTTIDLTQSEEDLIGKMQTVIQLFLDLLQVTDEDLAPEKCVWFWSAYTSFYMPSLGYGTPSTTLIKKDCEEIQKPVVNVMLSKTGIAHSAPGAVVFGTAQFG